jgi:sugar/nucleoside kinase (ribokinase family)
MNSPPSPRRILCYGVLCVDQILRVPFHPEADGHARILSDSEHLGGEATNTAALLSRLGLPVRLAGNAIGEDRRGDLFLRELRRFPGLDGSGISVDCGVRTPYAVILSSADGTRTILGHSPDMRSRPLEEAELEDAALLTVDPFLGMNATRAAEMARKRDLPVLAVEVEPGTPLADFSTYILNSSGFLRRHRLGEDAEVAVRLLKAGARAVVITRGAEGCRIFREDGTSAAEPALQIAARDTTGAGDAFRAGFLCGLYYGWDLRDTVRFATATAAVNCQGTGGCGGVESLEQVQQFLRRGRPLAGPPRPASGFPVGQIRGVPDEPGPSDVL